MRTLTAAVLLAIVAPAAIANPCQHLLVPAGVPRAEIDDAPAGGAAHVLTRAGRDLLIDVDLNELAERGPAALARDLGLAGDAVTRAWTTRVGLHVAARRDRPANFDAAARAAFAGAAADVLFLRTYRGGARDRAIVSLNPFRTAPPPRPAITAAELTADRIWFQPPRSLRPRLVTREVDGAGPDGSHLKFFLVHYVPTLGMKLDETADTFATVMTFVLPTRVPAAGATYPMYFVQRDRVDAREVWRIVGEARVDAIDAFFAEADFTARHPRPSHPLVSYPGDALPAGVHLPEVLMRLKPSGDPGQGVHPRENLNAMFAARPDLAGDLARLGAGEFVFAVIPAPAPKRGKAPPGSSFALFTRDADGVILVAWTPLIP